MGAAVATEEVVGVELAKAPSLNPLALPFLEREFASDIALDPRLLLAL